MNFELINQENVGLTYIRADSNSISIDGLFENIKKVKRRKDQL